MLLGLPGIICIWKFRDLTSETTSDDEAVDSSYEDILAAAEEFDKIVENEELAPSTYGKMDEFNPTLLDAKEDFGDEELLKKSISELKK